ncbi:hypothetical protein [Nocardioides sambongensis]|uniref:hypothetical protein n=1 Tax=Nocardioides sambongensis TaxID=2589074 RepID=UPI00112914BF|nr:hypothetical protein [Nocardioides sambongensis]
MGVTLDVPFTELVQAEAEWGDAGAELGGGWRRLEGASAEGFAPAVATAVEGFRESWVEELKRLADTATEHGLDLAVYRATLLATDVVRAEAIRALLPWRLHDARVEETR